jgi:hypothetical protein
MCGCGQVTPIATRSHKIDQQVIGQHIRYIRGHQRRTNPHEYVVNEETGCWEWARFKSSAGYGYAKLNGVSVLAHRLYWMRENGPIPDGYEIDHLCRNRACVNPAHMEVVSHKENTDRRNDALGWNSK